jgi:hypothetical protein
MSKVVLGVMILALWCEGVVTATAKPMAVDPLFVARQILQSSKKMSPVKRSTRLALDAQCSGQTQPIIACSCNATDDAGNCVSQSCDILCPGID